MKSNLRLALTYTCYDPTISNIEESETLTAVYGNHMSGKSNNDVGYLFTLHHVKNLTFFPKGIENFFSNLIAIEIVDSQIQKLQGNELNAFNGLTWFAFEYSLIERVPRNLFFNTPLVSTIFFNNNKIKHVGENLLDSLSLGYANFGNNYCVNQVATTANQIPSLIEHLRNNCTDIEGPSCGDMNVVICNLEDQNLEIKIKLETISLENLEMKEKLTKLSQENLQMKQMLNEVLEGISELITRP